METITTPPGWEGIFSYILKSIWRGAYTTETVGECTGSRGQQALLHHTPFISISHRCCQDRTLCHLCWPQIVR